MDALRSPKTLSGPAMRRCLSTRDMQPRKLIVALEIETHRPASTNVWEKEARLEDTRHGYRLQLCSCTGRAINLLATCDRKVYDRKFQDS